MQRMVCVLGLVAAAAGCEKSDSSSKASAGMGRVDPGPAPAGERALLKDLPKGNQLLLGGNFLKLQKAFATSPLAKLAAQGNAQDPGTEAWQSCFVDGPPLTLVGGLAYHGGTLDMQYAMRGMDVDGVAACAKRAGYPAKIDADRKFIAVDLTTAMGPMHTGYLVLPDGALLTRMALPLGGSFPVVDRAALEAVVAGLASGTAADDTTLVAAWEKVDHGKPIWIVASGAGTPLADKVGLVTATLDLADGLAVDATAELATPAIAEQVETGIAGAKASAAKAGPEIAPVIESIHVERTARLIHGTAAISNAQIAALAAKFGAPPQQRAQ